MSKYLNVTLTPFSTVAPVRTKTGEQFGESQKQLPVIRRALTPHNVMARESSSNAENSKYAEDEGRSLR